MMRMQGRRRLSRAGICAVLCLAATAVTRGRDQATPTVKRPGTHRVIALAEAGQTIHQPFADAAIAWLRETAVKEGFAVDYIRTTDPIDEAYLAAHDLFIQVN
jgi:hypothetical protein